jgi:RNA polymerase sigma factor for flagellar operon FliA
VVKHAAGETSGKEAIRGRRVSARRLVSMDVCTAYEEPLSARLPDGRTPRADEAAHANHQKRQLHAAMQRLPERQRMALEMGLFEGMALKEIGHRMGISESRVCQLQKRAVQHLNSELAQAA